MAFSSASRRDRIGAIAAAAAFHGLLAYAFLNGLGAAPDVRVEEGLELFDVPLPPPPPPPPEPPAPAPARKAEEGAASPENLKAKASPVVAPKPKVRLKAPPKIVTAPEPGSGKEPSAGASDRPGPGSGSGGVGSGRGSGRKGGGTGGGGGAVTPARLIGGRIVDADYPRSASRGRIGGTVIVRFTVGADGRAVDCRVTRSSGSQELDSTTCRLIEQRFRYRPALDSAGKAVPQTLGWKQVWWQEPR